jgi:glycosyltransferase involved in cell wall biosynthesis
VDGGSTDDTLAIIADYAQRMEIRLLRWTESPNWCRQTNAAIACASAPHVCMLHHDDCWREGRASTVREALSRNPGVALLLHASMVIDSEGRDLGRWSCPLSPEPKIYSPSELLEHLVVQNFIAIPSPTFRRDAALAVDGLDASLWYTGDWDFYLKLARTGPTVYLDRTLTSFRVHKSSLTMKGSLDGEDFRQQMQIVVERHIGALAPSRRRTAIERAAYVSNEINAALAAALHGSYRKLPSAAMSFLSLGPLGWFRYVRDSRILERGLSRLRVLRSLRAA